MDISQSQIVSFIWGIFDEGTITDITHISFYNSCKWTLNRIKSQATDNNDILYSNFGEYLNGYSENVKDVLRNRQGLKKNDSALLDLTGNFGIPEERLADYGIFTTESGSLVQYEPDSNLRDTRNLSSRLNIASPSSASASKSSSTKW